MSLRPFFSYYGAKWKYAPRYPAPAHDTIIEPFAGAAGYSVRHHSRKVLLFDIDPNIIDTWRYLISAPVSQILSIPILEPGQSVEEVNFADSRERILVGWWLNEGSSVPKLRKSSVVRRCLGWSPATRCRIAAQVDSIRHWRAELCDYRDIPDLQGTWFIDPPYINAGKYYRFGCQRIDYDWLGSWCVTRPGQVIVCENGGAQWLPFRDFFEFSGSAGSQKKSARSVEALCTFSN